MDLIPDISHLDPAWAMNSFQGTRDTMIPFSVGVTRDPRSTKAKGHDIGVHMHVHHGVSSVRLYLNSLCSQESLARSGRITAGHMLRRVSNGIARAPTGGSREIWGLTTRSAYSRLRFVRRP